VPLLPASSHNTRPGDPASWPRANNDSLDLSPVLSLLCCLREGEILPRYENTYAVPSKARACKSKWCRQLHDDRAGAALSSAQAYGTIRRISSSRWAISHIAAYNKQSSCAIHPDRCHSATCGAFGGLVLS
jgi:hypothetical protein